MSNRKFLIHNQVITHSVNSSHYNLYGSDPNFFARLADNKMPRYHLILKCNLSRMICRVERFQHELSLLCCKMNKPFSIVFTVHKSPNLTFTNDCHVSASVVFSDDHWINTAFLKFSIDRLIHRRGIGTLFLSITCKIQCFWISSVYRYTLSRNYWLHFFAKRKNIRRASNGFAISKNILMTQFL